MKSCLGSLVLVCAVLAGCSESARPLESQSAAPTEAELRALYESRRGEFVRDELRRVLHLRFDPSAKASAAAQLASFQADRSRLEGSDLGALSRVELAGKWGSELAEAVFALTTAHEVSLVETTTGIHLVMMTGKLDGVARTFDQVKERLRQRVIAERKALRVEANR